MTRTALEYALEANDTYRMAVRDDPTMKTLQETLDQITNAVCATVTPEEILDHTRVVYGETAVAYAEDSDHRNIPDSLITFMNMLPQTKEGTRVLELGTGPLIRDACFMGVSSSTFRALLMGRTKDGVALRDRVAAIPKVVFRVMATDGSEKICAYARAHRLFALDYAGDDGNTSFAPQIALLDMHKCGALASNPIRYDGVWSCAALFTHTPRELVHSSLLGVASVLKHGGIFGVSYPAGEDDDAYNKLLLSRTGRVKYFSQPTPTFIATKAEEAGFYLKGEERADFVRDGKVQKDFFVTQFFEKQ